MIFLGVAGAGRGKMRSQHLVKTKPMNQKDGQCPWMCMQHGLGTIPPRNTVQVKTEVKPLTGEEL